MDDKTLEELVRGALREVLSRQKACPSPALRKVPLIPVREEDRLNTGNPGDRVYTRDLFTLEESPRLGCGIMEMEESEFPWTLSYDEMDYVISGRLEVKTGEETLSAGAGELIYLPKGSRIRFSAPGKTRFLYVTYPADWKNQP